MVPKYDQQSHRPNKTEANPRKNPKIRVRKYVAKLGWKQYTGHPRPK